MSKYEISVDLSTVPAGAKVEVAGLGVFKNGTTTELSDEITQRWFADPRNALVSFPEGIDVKEMSPSRQGGSGGSSSFGSHATATGGAGGSDTTATGGEGTAGEGSADTTDKGKKKEGDN